MLRPTLATALLAMALTGCATNSATVAAPVTSPLTVEQKAIDGCAAVQSGLTLAQDALKTAYSGGLIDLATAQAINSDLQAVAVKNDAAVNAIKAAAASGSATGWQASVQAVVAAAGTLSPATLNIKNATAAQTFTSGLSVFQAAVATLTALVN